MNDEIIQKAKELGVSPGYLERVACDDGSGWELVPERASDLCPQENRDAPSWQIRGRFDFDFQGEFWKQLPNTAGVYRLQFDEVTFYFGEANDIRRRLGDYTKYYESTGIESESRIHNALVKTGAEVAVLVCEDFISHSARCVREHAEIKKAREAGLTVLNGGTLEERIAFHEREIIRLKAKLDIQKSREGASHE